jgi:hypothetical protein
MQYLLLAALPLVGGLINLLWIGGEWIVMQIKTIRQRRRERIERELDRQQAELRTTILRLASELGADAHEARKALIRESYLAAGRLPDQQ